MLTPLEIQRNIYVQKIINKYTPSVPILFFVNSTIASAEQVKKILFQWGQQYVHEIIYSGSYAKNTAITGLSDIDLFISLKTNTTSSLNIGLKEIYYNLENYIKSVGYQTRLQNVSIGITHNNVKIDLVPAVKQSALTLDHSIYKRKADTWTKTNVTKHINVVKNSNRANDIRAIKIWSYLHGLEFPSLYLELTVINALSGYLPGNPANHFWVVLNYIKNKFLSSRIIDPTNSTNIISDDLTQTEKQNIVNQAKISLEQGYWENIIW